MKHFHFFIASSLFFVACSHTPVPNPDPNHTHADFAVWIDGKQLDFSGPEFMSGTSDESDPDHLKHDKYLHLHDGNGHIIHRHKSGFTLQDFFTTLKVSFSDRCFTTGALSKVVQQCSVQPFRLFVNGAEKPFDHLSYAFNDGDKILITTDIESSEVLKQLSQLTDDACRYSKTCPWKGEPPTENCIADPEVPCIQKS